MFISGTTEKHKCLHTSMFEKFQKDQEIGLFKEKSLKPVCGPNMNNTENTLKIHAGFTCAQSVEVCTLW